MAHAATAAPATAARADWSDLFATGVLDDPWLGGLPRLSRQAEILSAATAGQLARAACAVAQLIDHLVAALAGNAALAERLGLSPSLAALAMLGTAPQRTPGWLGLARADVFRTAAGPQVCELNSDTPTGLAECTELARLAHATRPDLHDPSRDLAARWQAMVRAAVPAGVAGLDGIARDAPVAGLIDATEMTDDAAHIRLLSRWLRQAGFRVVRGAPFNLHACPGQRVGLFGTPCDVLVRHYKTDWWAARSSVWRDEPDPPEATMLREPVQHLALALRAGTLGVVNPFGAAIAQNKRLLALAFAAPEAVPATVRAAALPYLPETFLLDDCAPDFLRRDRGDLVLKSDYGCEGDEVLLGRECSAAEWDAALCAAKPERFVVQRAFVPIAETPDAAFPHAAAKDAAPASATVANYGVFLIGGTPSGIYTRRSPGATRGDARSHPTLMQPPPDATATTAATPETAP